MIVHVFDDQDRLTHDEHSLPNDHTLKVFVAAQGIGWVLSRWSAGAHVRYRIEVDRGVSGVEEWPAVKDGLAARCY